MIGCNPLPALLFSNNNSTSPLHVRLCSTLERSIASSFLFQLLWPLHRQKHAYTHWLFHCRKQCTAYILAWIKRLCAILPTHFQSAIKTRWKFVTENYSISFLQPWPGVTNYLSLSDFKKETTSSFKAFSSIEWYFFQHSKTNMKVFELFPVFPFSDLIPELNSHYILTLVSSFEFVLKFARHAAIDHIIWDVLFHADPKSKKIASRYYLWRF